jgi:hypothetical protein
MMTDIRYGLRRFPHDQEMECFGTRLMVVPIFVADKVACCWLAGRLMNRNHPDEKGDG